MSLDVYNAVILPASYTGDYEKTFDGTGPFQLESLRPSRAPPSCATPTIGATRRCPTGSRSSSSTTSRRRCWRCRRASSTSSRSTDAAEAGDRRQSQLQAASVSPTARMPSCICGPTRRRSPTSACAARWRSPSTARPWSRACCRGMARSATTPRSRRSSPRPIRRCRSASRTSTRPSGCSRRPACPTASR